MQEFRSNIQEVIDKLERIRTAVSGSGSTPPDFSDAMFSALNTGMGLMKKRIFNDSMDADGNPLGKYVGVKKKLTGNEFSRFNSQDPGDVSIRKEAKKKLQRLQRNAAASGQEEFSPYEKKRLAYGRQIAKKDLEFDGNLRRSIETVKDDNRVVVAIGDEENLKKARNQEQQIGNIRAGVNPVKGSAEPAKIFMFSKDEYEEVRNQGKLGIKAAITKIINSA